MDIARLGRIIEEALSGQRPHGGAAGDPAPPAPSQPFVVSGARLGAPAVGAVLAAFFDGGVLVLHDAVRVPAAGAAVAVRGRLGGRLAGMSGLTCTARFSIRDGDVALVVETVELPQGWKPSDSWPVLQGTVFDQWTWSSCTLTLDTDQPPPLPADFPVQFGYRPYTEDMRKAELPGLLLSGTISATSTSQTIAWLLSGTQWQVSGPVVGPDAQLSMVIATPPETGVSLGGIDFPFALNLVSAAVRSDDGTMVVATTLQLDAAVRTTLDDGSIFHFPAFLRSATTDPATMTIQSRMPPGQGITTDELSDLIGTSIDPTVPPGSLGFPELVGLELTDVEMVLAIKPSVTMLSLSATVKWFAPPTYSIFDGLIVFDHMWVSFTYLPFGYTRADGAVWYARGSVGAAATISGGKLTSAFGIPDVSFTCVLAEQQIDITGLVTATAGDSVTMPQIDCTALTVFGDYAADVYRFQATVTSDWTFDLGSTPFALQQISMDLDSDTQGFGGEIAAVAAIAGANLYGRSRYDPLTGGWTFSLGTVGQCDVPLTDLVAAVLDLFGVALPDNAPSLRLHALNLYFDSATGDFDFQCQALMAVSGTACSFGVQIASRGGAQLYKGFLWVSESYFAVDFEVDQKTTMTASWVATTEQAYLQFGDLASMLHLDAPEVPKGLDLNLQSASLTYGYTDGLLSVQAESAVYGKAIFIAQPTGETLPVPARTVYYAALAIDHPISISNLPILDALLGPEETAAIEALQVIFASGDITADEAEAVNAEIPAGYPKLPVTGTRAPFGLSAVVTFGGTRIPISLGMVDVSDQGGQSTAASSVVGSQGGTNLGSVTSTPPAASDGTMWFNIQKAFGPVTFDRIGIRYEDSVLWVALDASLRVGGLTLTLVGASIGSPITDFEPRFALWGLGVAYRSAPLEIGGGLVRVRPSRSDVTDQYDGSVVVKMPQFALTACGSYVELSDGSPSMFVLAQVHAKFGGPPAFFVTGILGGFGYNSRVRTPAPLEVAAFPFVSGIVDPTRIGGGDATPVEALGALTGGASPWVSPELGQSWITAGITFTSYELVRSAAVLMVQFGNDLTISLMGLSTATFPQGGGVPRPYAQVELQLLAVVQPSKGVFAVAANLTRSSYLLDPSVVLTGGFAFYLWFTPTDPGIVDRSGDFVIALGGYNPNFDKPAHYPDVPRIGFTWSYDATIDIRGGAYLAVTPSTIQAGGSLAINFHDGSLRAWLTAHADLIIRFKPFYFVVNVGVSVGVSYTMSTRFTNVTLGVELGADLSLWGPPTSGRATIHWWVISFTIAFGPANRPTVPLPLETWDEFATLLPPAGDVVKITPLTGLAPQPVPNTGSQSGGHGTGEAAPRWIVRSSGFSWVTSASIPLTTLSFGPHTAAGQALYVRPMRRSGAADQTIALLHEGAPADASAWSVTIQTANVAKALWGEGDGGGLEPGGAQLLTGQLSGFLVTSPTPVVGYTAGAIPVAANLGYDPLSPDGITPIVAGATPAGDQPVTDPGTVSIIAGEIAGSAVAPRDDLYDTLCALGVDPGANGLLTRFAAHAGRLFAASPMIVPT